jgi:hypothetical protein
MIRAFRSEDFRELRFPTRRDFVTTLAAAGTLALFPRLQAEAQSGKGATRRIDVHHHFTPEAYTAYQAATGRGGGGGSGRGGAGRGGAGRGAAAGGTSAFPGWTLSQDLEDMDKNGTATAILSITTPGFPGGSPEDKRKAMRGCNEAAAKLRSNPVAMGALRKVVPITQIVFGTDYWYRTAEETARGLVTSKVFTDAELRMINRGNVKRLLRKFKTL